MDGHRKAGFGVPDGSRSETTTRTGRFCDLIVRFVAMILTLAAAVVIGVDKQTKTVPLQLAASLPPLHVPVTARWHYLSSFVYFVVANAIACSYAAFSLVLSLLNKGKCRGFIRSAIIVMDILTVALLFSGFGAAAAVGAIGWRGNSHLNWNKMCNVFGRFCGQGAASLLLSLLGAMAFLSLSLLSAFRLQRGFK
ncbi:CASP-like protein 1E1 isoform X1 [Cucumis melo]|uniref:CASP-like protein n=2 Tax=Cucumis melo TaxID=3656 RepID=A0A1S3C7G4_CUCME|nr:CASP-like protein 1E1 isoform X1 [Cucumis melo]